MCATIMTTIIGILFFCIPFGAAIGMGLMSARIFELKGNVEWRDFRLEDAEKETKKLEEKLADEENISRQLSKMCRELKEDNAIWAREYNKLYEENKKLKQQLNGEN